MQIHWSHIVLVGIGGFIGSVLRFWVSNWFMQNIPPTWPWGTFLVNLLGCFVIGMVMGLPAKAQETENLRLFIGSGFCGGFTTFSAFSNEGFQMLRHQLYLLFAAYAVSSVLLGLAAVATGYFFIRSL